MHACEIFSMIQWEIFLQKEEHFRIWKNKEESSYIKKREISLICGKKLILRKNILKYGCRKW
jgi:hypothetical protein